MHDINNMKKQYFKDKNELIKVLTELANDGSYVFRGFNKQDQILPSIIRDKDYSSVESNLLVEFEKYGSHYFRANNSIDFLSYGQHYGLPTRLLDFTYNPFIALSFALFSQKSNGKYSEPEDKDYYYIMFCKLNNNLHLRSIPKQVYFTFGTFELDSISTKTHSSIQMFSKCLDDTSFNFYNDYVNGLYECDYQGGGDFQNYKDDVTSKINKKVLCFIDPNQSNQRIIMQQGLFMLPYTLSKEEHMDIIRKNTSIILIHKSLRESLLTYLDTLGYNTFRLMPDLTSVCSAITQKNREKQGNLK